MITKERFFEAPMWTIFVGDSEDPGPVVWELFDVSDMGSLEEMDRRLEELGLLAQTPQKVDDAVQPHEDTDDLDAALAFLRLGGALCKVPDDEDPHASGSKYWRLLVVEPLALVSVFLHLTAFNSAYAAITRTNTQ